MFALTGQEGKTFHPLAFTKSFAMIGVAILSITLVPALIPTLHQGPAAERGGKLARAEPDRHLQAVAHLAHAAAEPGHVVVLGPADRRRRPVPAGRRRGDRVALVLPGRGRRHDARHVIFIVGWRWQVLSFVTLAAWP